MRSRFCKRQAAGGGGLGVNLCVMGMMAITAWDCTIYMAGLRYCC